MGYSAAGITVDMLRQASQWFFNAENLRAANTILVDYHYHLAAGYTVGWGAGANAPPPTGSASGSAKAPYWARSFSVTSAITICS